MMRIKKTDLKEYDRVELITDRARYAKDGVYKGMQGWICYEKCVEGFSLVDFPLYGKAGSVATISVYDEDLRKITEGDDWINDRIKAEHEGRFKR